MATARSSVVQIDEEELVKKFEEWLNEKLRSKNPDQSNDFGLFINYISSTLVEEENTDEEKRETIRPFIQELNQVRFILFD